MNGAARSGRRGFLRSACMHCVGFGSLGLVGSVGAQTAPSAVMPARFAKPAIETDEGGLWAAMEREETRLRRSSFVMRDSGLVSYVQDLACRLAGDHCQDVRVHVVRTPHFNASMAPNGMMQVWSGLLLRVENEAQLAAVIGHELGHYFERHSLERLRDTKNRAAFAQMLGMFGLVGAIAQIGVVASMFAFSREHEQRADQIGIQLMHDAGYDGAQAALVWDNLLDELKVRGGEDVGKRSPMFATHPPVENRRDELLRLAGKRGGETGAAQFQQATAPFRMEWLQDELRRGQYEESLALFDRQLRSRPDDAQLLYARGEAYRLRDGNGDLARSLDDLVRSTATDAPPPEAFRSLGLLHRRRTDAPAAAAAFQKYLALAPASPDAGLIQTYLPDPQP